MPGRHRSRLRQLTIVIVVIMLVLPSTTASAKKSGTFIDDNHSPYEPLIERARAIGLVLGCNPPANDRFCPNAVVTRAEMAVMLDRAVGLPSPTTSHFVDDPHSSVAASIEALAEAGVTSGCSPDHFCPDRSLTRGEMAQFIAGAMGWDPPPGLSPYHDLDSSPYGPSLAMLGRRGDVEPCDPPLGLRLCPGQAVTREEAIYALTSALDLQPLSSPTASAEDLSVGFADGFDTLSLWDGRAPSRRNRVSLTEAGFKGKGLRVTIPRGSHFGSDFRLDLSKVAGEDPEALYFRYMLRLDRDWAPVRSGKLPGFSGIYGRTGKGGYPSTPSSPGWSARVQFFGTREGDSRARLGYYVYHLGQERRYGDSMMWNEAGKLQPGQWYCIEGEVEMNTPGLADGALRAWVDGTPAFDVDGIEFRRPDEPDIRIESFWFDVYYGGKPTAEKSMGMTIDEVSVDTQRVGCGGDAGLSSAKRADVNGDGFDDRLWWGSCPGGTCFQVDDTLGVGAPLRVGDGAWFSLETQKLGMATGDVDADGRQDVVYRGRCGESQPCWRVQRWRGSTLGPGENWGDGARFAPGARGLVGGDWNGDGLDDLTYQGLCGSDAAPCWRVHLSSGDGFEPPANWGQPGPAPGTDVEAADLDGDRRDDLAYRSKCPEGTCWFAQYSTGSAFRSPVALGPAFPAGTTWWQWFDYDGDGSADLLYIDATGKTLEMRATKGDELTPPRPVAALPEQVESVVLRRVDSEVQARAAFRCEKTKTCVDRLRTWDGSLVPEIEYHRQVITTGLYEGPFRVA